MNEPAKISEPKLNKVLSVQIVTMLISVVAMFIDSIIISIFLKTGARRRRQSGRDHRAYQNGYSREYIGTFPLIRDILIETVKRRGAGLNHGDYHDKERLLLPVI